MLFSTSIFTLAGSAFSAAAPNIVSYQGRLLDTNGVPVTATSATVIFRLYDSLAGATCLWSNSSSTCASTTGRTVTLTDGLFSENLGDTAAGTPYAAIPDTVFSDNSGVYLSVSVNGELLAPRKQMVAAPYALNAQTLDGIDSSAFLQSGGAGSFSTLTSTGNTTVATGASTVNTFGAGASSINTIGAVTTPGALTLHGATTLDDTFTVSGSNLTLLGGNLTVTGTAWTATPTISGLITATSGLTSNGNVILGDAVTDSLTITAAIQGLNALVFDGATDNTFETTFAITDPTADRTITFQNNDGLVPLGTAGNTLFFTTTGPTSVTLPTSGTLAVSGTDSLDFTDFADSLTLDASTSIGFGAGGLNLTFTNNGSGNEIHNLSSTGDFVIQDNGTPFATFADTGAVTFAATSGQIITLGTTAADLAFQTTTSGNITATTGAAAGLFNVLTGNLKVGAGTPGVALNGEDAYVTGTLEVDGAVQFDGTLTASDLVCTDCLDFTELADAMTLDASTSIAAGQDNTLSLTSSLAFANRTAAAFTITQANDAFDFGDAGIGLVEIQQNDISSAGTALHIVQAGAGSGGGLALWVDSGNALFDANAVVGGSTSTTETLSNTGFVVNGDDLFVAGTVGVEGDIYTDGSFIAGATTTYSNGTITQSTSGEGSLTISTTGGTSGNINISPVQGSNFVVTTGGAGTFLETLGVTDGVGHTMQADSLTNGINLAVLSASNTFNAGGILTAAFVPEALTTSPTGAVVYANAWPIYSTAVTTPTYAMNNLSAGRNVTTNGAFASTLTISQPLATFTDGATQTTGTITSTADVVRIDQSYAPNSGSALNVTTSGSGFALRVNDDGTFTDSTPFVVDGAGNVGIGQTSLAATTKLGVTLAATDQILIDAATTDHTSNSPLTLNFDTNGAGVDSGIQVNATSVGMTAGTEMIMGIAATAVSVATDAADSAIFNITSLYNSTAATAGNIALFQGIASSQGGGLASAYTGTGSLSGYEAHLELAPATTNTGSGYGILIDIGNSGATNYNGSITGADIRINDLVSTNTVVKGIQVDNQDATIPGDYGVWVHGLWDVGINIGEGTKAITTGVYITNVTTDISLQNGETIDNDTDGTILLSATGPVTLISTSATTTSINLSAQVGGTGQRLCHDGADAATGVQQIGDCGAAQADLAEYYGVADDAVAGHIVVPFGQATEGAYYGGATTFANVVKSDTAYQTAIGIVSTNPSGEILGESAKPSLTNPKPIALVGRTPLKVNVESGTISAGDPIATSSVAGVGMKATQPGMVVGYALSDWSGPGEGTIVAYIQPGWHAAGVISNNGTVPTFTSDFAFTSRIGATSGTPGQDSHGLAFLGSGWNGSAAETIGMSLKTKVTDATQYRLSFSNKADTEVAYVTQSGDLVISGKLYPADHNGAQTSKYIYYDESSGPAGDMMRTNASGWGTGSYDFAEMFPSIESLVPGEVVVFSKLNGHLERSKVKESTQLAGIVSTKPGFLAGNNDIGSIPVALKGRVPTMVVNENGPIEVGDPLTSSSTPGYAMKATKPGMIVGYALEPMADVTGTIITFVSLGWWQPAQDTAPIPGTSNTASLFSANGGVSFSSLSMNGAIYMNANDILNVRRIAGMADKWSIGEDGTVKTEGEFRTIINSYQNEKVEVRAVNAMDSFITLVGTSTVQNGTATVSFAAFDPHFNGVTSTTAPVRVLITPNGPVNLYVTQKDANGFTVQEIGGASSGTTFDWMVYAYRKDYEPKPLDPNVTVVPPVVDPNAPVVDPNATTTTTTPLADTTTTSTVPVMDTTTTTITPTDTTTTTTPPADTTTATAPPADTTTTTTTTDTTTTSTVPVTDTTTTTTTTTPPADATTTTPPPADTTTTTAPVVWEPAPAPAPSEPASATP